MTKPQLLFAATLVAAAAFVTPAMAQQATQEPGALGFNYPDSHYLTGGYGVRASPGPGFYYRHPAPRAMYEAPVPYVVPAPGYGYYYRAYPYWPY